MREEKHGRLALHGTTPVFPIHTEAGQNALTRRNLQKVKSKILPFELSIVVFIDSRSDLVGFKDQAFVESSLSNF